MIGHIHDIASNRIFIGFGLELSNDRCGELPVMPLAIEGYALRRLRCMIAGQSLIEERIRKLKED